MSKQRTKKPVEDVSSDLDTLFGAAIIVKDETVLYGEPVAEAAPVVEATPVVEPTVEKTPVEDTDYPEPMSLAEAYANGLLPSNLLPSTQLPLEVAATPTVTPIAVVELDGQVFPPVLPYKPEAGVIPLYTDEDVARYMAKYEASEQARVDALMAKHAKPNYDATEVAPKEEEPEDDLYGEPLSDSVIAAFGSLRKG